LITVKKYSNRRLYDTSESRYITLDELANKIRGGVDARVIDASSGDDLTQATLAQLVMESRGASKLLPVPLLTEMIRMGDDALAEFMGQYMAMAMHMYVQARSGGAPGFAPWMNMPWAQGAAARMMGSMPWMNPGAWQQPYGGGYATPPSSPPMSGYPPPPPPPDPAPEPHPDPNEARDADIAALRAEMQALKETLLAAARKDE
jgi:polyhydroxyalkanoate synthesis repressor PhaR